MKLLTLEHSKDPQKFLERAGTLAFTRAAKIINKSMKIRTFGEEILAESEIRGDLDLIAYELGAGDISTSTLNYTKSKNQSCSSCCSACGPLQGWNA